MNNRLYSTKEWLVKRDEILDRDNFSCQVCKNFNPRLGMVRVPTVDGNSFEYHQCLSSPSEFIYTIITEDGFSVEIHLKNKWIVFPVLQVHHKRYIEAKKPWEYDNTDLITLCKRCHTLVHTKFNIPVFDQLEDLVETRKFTPTIEAYEIKHDFPPWTVIEKSNTKEGYQIASKLSPTMMLFIPEKTLLEEYISRSYTLMTDFFGRFLPIYMTKQN